MDSHTEATIEIAKDFIQRAEDMVSEARTAIGNLIVLAERPAAILSTVPLPVKADDVLLALMKDACPVAIDDARHVMQMLYQVVQRYHCPAPPEPKYCVCVTGRNQQVDLGPYLFEGAVDAIREAMDAGALDATIRPVQA